MGISINGEPQNGYIHVFFSWKIYENLTKMDDFGSFNASIWRIPNSRPSWPTSTARGPSTWRRFQHVSTEVSGCFTDFFTDVFWKFKFMDIYGCLWMFIDVYGCIWLMVCGGDAVAAALLPTFRTWGFGGRDLCDWAEQPVGKMGMNWGWINLWLYDWYDWGNKLNKHPCNSQLF